MSEKYENKNKIRFENLPLLLKDMEIKQWIIDSFEFLYKNHIYIVILRTYKEGENKPSKFAKAKVEFIDSNSIENSINAYIDFYNVWFTNREKERFRTFFGIANGKSNRDLFNDFSKIFANYIPKEKTIYKNEGERNLMARRVEGNNPNAIYCYDVRRNGKKENDLPNIRSIENSNKAKLLRPKLYEKYYKDTNLSFFFSDDSSKERTDEEIIKSFANR
ncbi:MAG: DUF6037 family protein [Lachnospirales bacterium]|nr:hypothetical protein [Clostridiales bacterium]